MVHSWCLVGSTNTSKPSQPQFPFQREILSTGFNLSREEDSFCWLKKKLKWFKLPLVAHCCRVMAARLPSSRALPASISANFSISIIFALFTTEMFLLGCLFCIEVHLRVLSSRAGDWRTFAASSQPQTVVQSGRRFLLNQKNWFKRNEWLMEQVVFWESMYIPGGSVLGKVIGGRE